MVKRIAGWPDSAALVAGVTSHPCDPVPCGQLLRLRPASEMGDGVFEAAWQAVEVAGGSRISVSVLHELAATIHERHGHSPTPGTLLSLWDMQVRCGALLAMLMIGCENAGGGRRLVDYIRVWRERGITVRHAAWHIADGNPEPMDLRRHRARGCAPEAFMTLWALAGRGPANDPLLSEAFYWLRATHHIPGNTPSLAPHSEQAVVGGLL